ncbi:glycosyltransferase family 4 protein [Propionivibrio limicola]|uniref:glycosyltransferase family 4 protein n=1 Tax=Propionivibrio limicola TaxID=167645 RepID=UPI001292923C|nr:glycosyltransferase family 4 protein [Propionivibrio limicola]
MRILYHHRTASKDGQAVHIAEMIDALRAEGHEVRVVAPAVGEGEKGKMGRDIGWVNRLKKSLPMVLYELLELAYSLHAYRKLKAAARDFRPDVIYERYNLYLLAGALLKKRLGIPLLLEVNSPLVFERSRHSGGLALPRLARWAEGTAWRAADRVLPVTKVLAGYVREYGVPDERIAVIPNGINKAHFATAPEPELAKAKLGLQGRLVLGFTGFVRDWHGVDRVIDWMASEEAPDNVHLLIVGDGPAREALEAQARALGLARAVTFTGVVDRDAVPSYVAAFDVALQPAVTAYASPLKMMEYLVLGKAIVAPRTPNICEILSDGENAALFDENVPGSLERALTTVCCDAALCLHLSANARETIDRLDLTWRGNARRVASLAAMLISNPESERVSTP